jgi:hypothetical protein
MRTVQTLQRPASRAAAKIEIATGAQRMFGLSSPTAPSTRVLPVNPFTREIQPMRMMLSATPPL